MHFPQLRHVTHSTAGQLHLLWGDDACLQHSCNKIRGLNLWLNHALVLDSCARPGRLFMAVQGVMGGSMLRWRGPSTIGTTRQTMQRSGKDFTIVKLLPPGV